MSINKARNLMKDIKNGNIKPVYLLTGDEPFYIDEISKFIEKNVLTEEEKGFNQTVFYGRDIEIEDIISTAKRFPMMAERQVVIVKEAQDLSKTIEKLTDYVKNPQPTTMLVLCYKYKKLDGRLSLTKEIKKHGIYFESKTVYENKIPDWIKQVAASKRTPITEKSAQMLVEYLGTDLSKINNELQKLQVVLKPGEQITPEIIEEYTGISKDFNNFELQRAIGQRDRKKGFAIIQYFMQNPKENPMVVTLGVLYGFYAKLYKYHALQNKSEAAKALGVSPFFIQEYITAAQNISMKQVSRSISAIREIDNKGKGVGSNITHADLLKELFTAVF